MDHEIIFSEQTTDYSRCIREIHMTTTPLWKRCVVNFFRVFIALGTVFICFEIGIWLHPPLMAWGLGVIDPKLICTSGEVLRGSQQHARIYDGARAIKSKSKVIASD